MLNRTFIEDYFKNPFVIWGLIVLAVTTFDSLWVSVKIIESILLLELYIPILFASLTISIIISTYPIRPSLRQLVRQREHRNYAIILGVLLMLIPYTDAVYFLSDPMVLLTVIQPQIVTDKETLDYIDVVKMIMQFIAIPFFAAVIQTLTKTKLKKEGYEINHKFRQSLRYIIEIILINGGMYVVFLIISHFLQ